MLIVIGFCTMQVLIAVDVHVYPLYIYWHVKNELACENVPIARLQYICKDCCLWVVCVKNANASSQNTVQLLAHACKLHVSGAFAGFARRQCRS